MAEEDEDESPHVNMDKTDEEAQDTCPALDNELHSEVDDFTIEEDDRVYNNGASGQSSPFCLCLKHVSRHLAEAFAKNSKPKGFEDIVPMSVVNGCKKNGASRMILVAYSGVV
jgi:hypothetical protein